MYRMSFLPYLIFGYVFFIPDIFTIHQRMDDFICGKLLEIKPIHPILLIGCQTIWHEKSWKEGMNRCLVLKVSKQNY